MSRTSLFARPIYWLLILALVLSLALVAPVGSRVNADPSEVWVCPTGDCGHPGAEYDNIQDGIDAVAQPGTVHVAAGTYAAYNIDLKNNVHVLGAGAAVTTIDGGGSGPVVLATSVGPGTKLDGFTITNSTALSGGGIYLDSSSPVISNCVFDGNSAPGGFGAKGGGMYNDNYYGYSLPTVTNCVFDGNSATGGDGKGGGMYNIDSSPTVTNCILANNSAGSSGGGIYADGTSSPTIDYNDVWNNPGGNYDPITLKGPNDISVDPMFVNPAAQDFHLMSGSPCIDAGTNDGAPGEDMDGNHRPIDGNGDGTATADMGAYEYVPAAVEFSATPTTGPTPLEVQFSDQSPGDFDSWNWDFGDGGTSSEQNPTHVYTLPGSFTVSLNVSSPSGGGTETKADYIHPYAQGVGGEAYPVSRLAILAPWFALAALLLGGTGWLVLRRRSA